MDQNDPVVRIYYGLEDGGFSQQDWNNSFVDVNGGSPVVLGDFNLTITGLTPGERYYFRAFAQSADGVDWSSGDPEVISCLLGYWRMDETNGSVLIDSIAPFHNAGLSVLEENRTRTTGYLGRGIYLSGNPDYVNLDLNNTGYLEQSFDGRSVSIWIKPDQEFYTGPTVTKYESLVGYYNFDNQVGSKVNDLSINESLADLINGSSLTSGQYGQSLNLDGTNDKVTIPTSGGMASLNQGSHTISMWIKPNQVNTGTYTAGRLHAHGFLRGIDNIYYTNIETMLALTPSGSNYLTSGPGNRAGFNNDSDYRNAGIGITRNDQYLSLFNGVFFAPSTGTYQWEIRGNDDRGTIWLDLDQDGVFEINGDFGSEQLVYQPQCCGTKSTNINLVSGYYRIAIAHGEGGGGSNQEAYFKTPGGGPTSLTKIKPSDQPTLFMTENQKTIMSRGDLRLLFDGDNNLVYEHADQSGSVTVSTANPINQGNWVHVAVSVDYDAGKLALYQDGQLSNETFLSNGAPIELSSAIPWVMGGNQVTWGDFFQGQIDDLRFYSSSLSPTEIMDIFNNDVSGSSPAARKNQVLYDEGTQNTGLSIALDDQGIVQARIGDQGSVSTVFSENSIRDGAWHHLVVTFGDSPKAFKMYLDGQLMNQPVIHSSGVISLHLDDPSLGAISGSLPEWFYKGFLDDLEFMSEVWMQLRSSMFLRVILPTTDISTS